MAERGKGPAARLHGPIDSHTHATPAPTFRTAAGFFSAFLCTGHLPPFFFFTAHAPLRLKDALRQTGTEAAWPFLPVA